MSKLTTTQVTATIRDGETVYGWVSRMAATHAPGYWQWCPTRVVGDSRPATARKVMHALSLIRGDVTARIWEGLTGTPVDAGCDAATRASVAAVLRYAR